MPLERSTHSVKKDILVFLGGLINYDRQQNLQNPIQITARWDKENLKIRGTIAQLIKFLPQDTPHPFVTS